MTSNVLLFIYLLWWSSTQCCQHNLKFNWSPRAGIQCHSPLEPPETSLASSTQRPAPTHWTACRYRWGQISSDLLVPVLSACPCSSPAPCLPLCQGMGGQHGYFGLWLDSDFGRGHSRARPKCTTYGSPQLSGEEDFTMDSMEVWAVGKPPEPEEVRDNRIAQKHNTT